MSHWNLSWISLFVTATATVVQSLGIQGPDALEPPEDISYDDERFIIVPAFNLNLSAFSTAGLPVAIALAASVLSLIGTVALGAILISLFAKLKYDDGYGYSSYANSYRALDLFDPSLIDWEKFSIIDLINICKETMSKYEPTNKDCQRRLICEIHRDAKSIGPMALKIVQMFKYLSYVKVLALPDEIQDMVNDFQEAAMVGISARKECGEIFAGCKFSLSKVVTDYKKNQFNESSNHIN